MRFAYADPPYFGCAERLYGPEARIYDTLEGHYQLFVRLRNEYPAGWALSCRSANLWDFAAFVNELFNCRPRIAAWVKPFASFKPNVNPAYCWEPVIFYGGRSLERDVPTVRDYVSANITLQRGTPGAKPDAFWFWLFQMLGAEPEDEFTDLFPGSGGGARCWDAFCSQGQLLVRGAGGGR